MDPNETFLDPIQLWQELEAGSTMIDNVTGLRYEIHDGKLMVFNPFGGWEHNQKPVEWFMQAQFKLIKKRPKERVYTGERNGLDKEEWERIQHDGVYTGSLKEEHD